MSPDRRVLVTGIAGDLARLTAQELERRDEVARVVGVDVAEPAVALERTEFVRTDPDDRALAEVIATHEIDTVVHLGVSDGAVSDGAGAAGRTAVKERNVIGTMQLLAACQNAPGVQRFVLRSSTAVYGSSHTDPALFTERAQPATAPEDGFAKDVTEIEGYVRAFARHREDVGVAVLRFAPVVGPHLVGPLEALLALPVVPRVLGFDPRVQFCHEEDAVEVLVRAAVDPHTGVTNVAGDGALYLSQCLRLARRFSLPLPGPALAALASLMGRAGQREVSSDELRYLHYGRVVDTERLRTEIGYRPRYSSRAAFEDLLRRGSDRTDRATGSRV